MGFIWFVYPDFTKIRGSNLFLCVFVLTTAHDAFVVQKVSKIWDERMSRAGRWPLRARFVQSFRVTWWLLLGFWVTSILRRFPHVQTHCKNNYGLFLILRRSLTKSSLSFSCNFPYGSWLPRFLGWVMCWLHPKLCATQVLGNSLLKGSQVERPWLETSWRYWKRTPGFCGVRMGYYHEAPKE